MIELKPETAELVQRLVRTDDGPTWARVFSSPEEVVEFAIHSMLGIPPETANDKPQEQSNATPEADRFKIIKTILLPNDLAEEVSSEMRKGWTPQGGPFHAYGPKKMWLCQAMVNNTITISG